LKRRGSPKLDPGHNRPHFFTYVYSRPAIDRFLEGRAVHWRWYDNLGVSRAGWFANEHNSALVVSRTDVNQVVAARLR
jgi:hypothetical protein